MSSRPEAPAGYGHRPVPPGARGPVPAPLAAGAGTQVLAEWWRRVVALIVDGLVIAAVGAVVLLAVGGPTGLFSGGEGALAAFLLSLAVAFAALALAALLYAPAFMAVTNGQTLGRQAVGIRVVRTSGAPTGFWWSALREVVVKQVLFAGLLSSFTFGLAWLLDGLWPLWDEENRALHDLVVSSRVVRT